MVLSKLLLQQNWKTAECNRNIPVTLRYFELPSYIWLMLVRYHACSISMFVSKIILIVW